MERVEKPLLELKPERHNKRINRRKSEIIFIILMLLLPVLQFVIFWIVPNFDSIIMGFQNPGTGEFSTINFEKFFSNLTQPIDSTGHYNEIVYAIKNSLIYFAINIFISTPIVIFFSYVLFRKVPLNNVFKVVFYLPSIVGITVTAMLYKTLLEKGSPLYNMLYSMGVITKDIVRWGLFGSEKTAFTMVIIYSVWTCVGLNMIMFHGAMKRIPEDIFESAQIDGIGFFRQFFNIVLPLIWPTISTLVVFALSGIFVSYGAVMILTPSEKTASMIGWYIVKYTTAKDSHASLQYPAAVGLLFTAVGLPFVLLIRWLLDKVGKNVEY